VFNHAIVRPPGPRFAEGLTTANLGPPIPERALNQHDRYCRALEQCGLNIVRLEADARHPDSTFVEDTAILTKKRAILSRPGAPSRQGEVESVRETLARFFRSIETIVPPGTLDGGDILEIGDHFFIGISERTNEDGGRQLSEILARDGYSSSFIDIRETPGILHLKSGVAWLGAQQLAVIDPLADQESFRAYDVVRVESGEEYAANCVRVNTSLLFAAGYPRLERKLQTMGYDVITLDMSEFRKMDGGLSCLSLRF